MRSIRPTQRPMANVSNAKAAHLAKAVNSGGDVTQLVREAIVDAQIHKDWARVAAVENSLENVEHRQIARHLGAVGTRAVVVSRGDGGALASKIPAGFDHGLAWLVCLLFVRTDSDMNVAEFIGESFHRRVRRAGGFGIDWGPAAMCLPPVAFGGPTRISVTEGAGRGDLTDLERIKALAEQMIGNQAATSTGPQAVAHVLWGTVVTGTSEPLRELFDEAVWCPGFQGDELAPALTSLLAQVATEVDGDTFIHPKLLSAPEATDFARQMVNEQIISGIVEDVVKPRLGEAMEGASVRISKMIPPSRPFMDQILISFWGRANILFQTYRIPRTGRSLEHDAEEIASFCRAQGIRNVKMVDVAKPVGADDFVGQAVGLDGTLLETSVAALGDAAILIREIDWYVDQLNKDMDGIERLPYVQFLAKQGALSALSSHYASPIWPHIKDALSQVGDPIVRITDILARFWESESADLAWLLDAYRGMLVPARDLALAAQFELANGTFVRATPALLELLENTDIGEECPAEHLRTGFEMMYLLVRVPARAYVEPGEDEPSTFIDGILLQRWEEGGTETWQIDAFVTSGEVPDAPDFLVEVAHARMLVAPESTLADLRVQVDLDDGLLHQVLDIVAGVMLYMNSRDARVERKDDHARAAAALGALNRKKRKKEHYERLNSSVDAIHVGPETFIATGAPPSFGGVSRHGVRPHYRRGFVRFNQRVGKGREQTRPVLIPPVLVNAHKLAGSPPPKKQYVVGKG